MTPEIWTMIGVGVAIAALILVQARHSNRLISDRIATMEQHLNDRFQHIEIQMADLNVRMAHLKGFLLSLNKA